MTKAAQSNIEAAIRPRPEQITLLFRCSVPGQRAKITLHYITYITNLYRIY